MMNGESIYGDPFETALLTATEQGRARSAALRKTPLISTPTHGVESPQPGAFDQGQYAPQDVGLEPQTQTQPQQPTPATPDYRGMALKAMQDASSAGEPTEEERGESNRKVLLALALGMK